MTNSIADFEKADVILVTGSNTTEAHPVLANYIKRAVLYNNAKLIVIDPRKIDLVRYATVWLRQRSGSDTAWINGLVNVILNENLQNDKFIAERTEGIDALRKSSAKYTPEYVEKISGIPKDKLIEAARLYGKADKGSIAWTMGITQHTNGTDNVKALANLAMITGNVGKEGTGCNPLRGQNNVQGSCDMGALSNSYPGYQKVFDLAVKEKFEKAWQSPNLSSEVGLTIVEMMNAAAEGKFKALYIMGENSLVSDANINHVEQAVGKLDLLIVQDIFLTETAQYADVVFPAKSSLEKEGTFTNTERRVLMVNKVLESKGDIKDDWAIIQALAEGMGYFWQYDSWKDIMKEINIVTPQYRGITPERLMNDEKIQWPCPDSNHPGTPILHIGKFARGLGVLHPIEHTPPKEITDKEYPFVMTTGRILYHYHTGSMTRRSKSLNKYVNDPYFEMNADDMKEMNISDGEKVRLKSRRGEIVIAAKASDKVAGKNVFVPFHFAEAAANRLTLDDLDPASKIPEYKVCAISIQKL
jgi:formate dehydrogenase major subunit